MVRQLSRRTFLAATGSGVTVGLAGCSGQSEPAEDGNESDDGMDDGSDGGSEEIPSVPEDASVSFAEPTGDEPASGGVSVVMEASEVEIEEAGEVNDGAGHFHVLVDTEAVERGETIPSDDQHIHFGDGSSETVLDLEPGEHTLVLQLADGQHRAFDLTDTVDVTVEEASASFVGVEDGDTVSSPVELEWEAEGYEIEESGEVTQGAGHAHVLIDEDPVEVGEEIPSDDQHVHFGDGAASGEVELEAGEHELTLQMGNGHHLATPLTDSVTVTVE